MKLQLLLISIFCLIPAPIFCSSIQQRIAKNKKAIASLKQNIKAGNFNKDCLDECRGACTACQACVDLCGF